MTEHVPSLCEALGSDPSMPGTGVQTLDLSTWETEAGGKFACVWDGSECVCS